MGLFAQRGCRDALENLLQLLHPSPSRRRFGAAYSRGFMELIRLPNGVWSYDPDSPLGKPGGFGAVFLGSDANGHRIAVKKLRLGVDEAAHRELRIAHELRGREFKHVMPLLDAGQDAESTFYFVIMPVAERNLEEAIRVDGPMEESMAIEVLIQIAKGLDEIPEIVHRDLKPANVLMYEGAWHIADFGIARFVEESTSEQTLKECLSPQYAAPEQWKYEHATAATDIYALGCIAHALMTGKPPFDGNVAQLQDKHLHTTPPRIDYCGPQMQILMSMMLRKLPQTRPSLGRVLATLQTIKEKKPVPGVTAGLDRLAAVAADHERVQAETESERQKAQREFENRVALALEARKILEDVFRVLADQVVKSVPSAKLGGDGSSRIIQVGDAFLELDLEKTSRPLNEGAFARSHWDVLCGAVIEVRQRSPSWKRQASLWYTRRNDKNADYRWFEVGYEGSPFSSRRPEFEPCALDAEGADRAHSAAVDIVQVSYPPIAIDDEDVHGFCKRWVFILAEACAGRLQNLPRALPQD